MELNLDELEQLAAQATPGPWEVRKDKENWRGARYEVETHKGRPVGYVCNWNSKVDAAYIVAACNSLPVLIGENRALQERVRELERERDWLAFQHAKACLDAANDACAWSTGDCPVCPLDKGGKCLEVTSKTFIEAAEKATKETKC